MLRKKHWQEKISSNEYSMPPRATPSLERRPRTWSYGPKPALSYPTSPQHETVSKLLLSDSGRFAHVSGEPSGRTMFLFIILTATPEPPSRSRTVRTPGCRGNATMSLTQVDGEHHENGVKMIHLGTGFARLPVGESKWQSTVGGCGSD